MRKASLYAAGAAVAAFTAVAASAPPAHALLQFSADISGVLFACQDNAACDTNPIVGQLGIDDQTVNGVQITGWFQRSTTTPSNLLASSSTAVINNSGDDRSITLAIGDTDYIGPGSSVDTTGSGTFVFNQGNSITLNYYVDNANTQGAESPNDTPGVLVDTFTFAATLPLHSFSHNATTPFATGALFSMTEQLTHTLAPGAALTSRGLAMSVAPVPVPEPASLALLGAGLLGFGLWRRRRKTA